MLTRVVEKAINIYKTMESARYFQSFGIRPSKKDVFEELLCAESYAEKSHAIHNLVIQHAAQGGKLKLIIDLLQICINAQNDKPAYNQHLNEINELKQKAVPTTLLTGINTGLNTWFSDNDFYRDYTALCNEVETDIRHYQEHHPILTVEQAYLQASNDLIQIIVKHDEIEAQYKNSTKQNNDLELSIAALKQKLRELHQQEIINAHKTAEISRLQFTKKELDLQLTQAEAHKRAIEVSLLQQDQELKKITNELNRIYLFKNRLQHQCIDIQEKLHEKNETIVKEQLNEPNTKAKHTSDISASEQHSDIQLSTDLKEKLHFYENEIKRLRDSNNTLVTQLKNEKTAKLNEIEQLRQVILKLKNDTIISQNTQHQHDEQIEQLIANNTALSQQIHELQNANEQLAKQTQQEIALLTYQNKQMHLQLEKTAANMAEYHQAQQANFIYVAEDDDALKPGDLKKLIELAGSDHVFEERYQAFANALKDKIGPVASSEQNKPYILELNEIEILFKKYISVYDPLFRFGKYTDISQEERRNLQLKANDAAMKAIEKAQQSIVFHNATERVVQQHLSYETNRSQTSEADKRYLTEANKSIHINKCRAGFYEELLKRAENMLPKNDNPPLIVDFSKRLSVFIQRNLYAIRLAVVAGHEKEKRMLGNMKKIKSYVDAPILFASTTKSQLSSSSIVVTSEPARDIPSPR